VSGLFALPGPRWFNIPAHRPFAEDLASGLHEALSPLGPEALSEATVLTPTRRGARALADAFVTAARGRAVLPPQMRPLGDLEEGEPPFEPGDLALHLPAAIEPLRRRFELTRLVAEHAGLLPGRELTAASALELADALGGFFDSLQIEELDAGGRLAELVEADLAEHWRVSREFLETALREWPKRLAALGVIDVSERRVRLLRALAEAWSLRPPQGVLVAAGSTGTAPATADLLRVIAAAPQGCVVLPGLDDSLAEDAWAHVEEQHPQGAMRRLLARAGVDRAQVATWPASQGFAAQGRWRRRIVNEALRPPEATADWLRVIELLRLEAGAKPPQPASPTAPPQAGEQRGGAPPPWNAGGGSARSAETEGAFRIDPIEEGLRGLSLVTARNEEEAATVAALLLREALETPELTAALVTPDQALARRVTARLARWGVVPDSSAGETLAGCRAGVLAQLAARAAADPTEPVGLLAILKHPFVRLGLASGQLGREREALERHALRGARAEGWEALTAKLDAARARLAKKPETAGRAAEVDTAAALLGRLRAVLAPLAAVFAAGAAAPALATRTLAEMIEALARDADGRLGDLWSGHGGEAMSRLLAGLIREGEGLPPTSARGFADLLERLLQGETVRAGGATHPRLRILGAIEARLVRADRLVLAGLEEGVWPRGAPVDPFLSRPMRAKLGLPSPERRIGLSAHDFAQAACAPEVVLLHTERREGAPSVKSRWLWRLETLARGAGVAIPGRSELVDWARALDAPDGYEPAKRPAPRPPLEHRPRKLAVTRVEALTRDPYAVWARDILKLYPLERPDEPVEARARGTAIHAAFERFSLEFPRALPADAAGIFAGYYLEALRAAGMPREGLARETALAREAAAWVAELEQQRRADGRAIHVEKEGKLDLMIDGTAFTLTAKADRIEADPHGHGHILDYKTGRAPSQKMVDSGFSPQLTLTAAILAAGGFAEIGALRPGELTYLEVTGRKPAGREEPRAVPGGVGDKIPDSAQAAAEALEGLGELLRRYFDPREPYASRIAPQFVRQHHGDYDHLARVFEWSTSGEEGEG
jgi:ATP-dependent helicase/nuclease subunit B